MKRIGLLLLVIMALFFVIGFPDSILNSKHNLSAGGPGSIKTDETSKVCIFCHTSHHSTSSAPLWNREESTVVYSLYDSSTLHSTPDQPDGASKLCLSCHDGTIALGKILSPPNEFNMQNTTGGRIPQEMVSNLGMDLEDDHPISFDPTSSVNASSELAHPYPGDMIQYDASGKIQCTSCHNPHDDAFNNFLVQSNLNASICKTCHQISGFNQESTHDLSDETWNGMGENPWPHTIYTAVGDNACMNCHRNHQAGGKERLLKATDEAVCLVCHNGNAGKDISADLAKTSGHKVTFYQGHDPTEDILTAPVHVACVDCHNPHRVNSSTAQAPDVNGRSIGMSGMTITGSITDTAQYEYEVCLKCHGQDQYMVATTMNRMFDTSNKRMVFNPGNISYHPVAAEGKGSWVPSLIPPYTTSSIIYCTDCHNSDTSVRAGGTGPNGPHGSNNEYLLERRYETMDYTHWSLESYALCYKCHNSDTLFDDHISGFEDHEKHVKSARASCSVCHDPHGSPSYVSLLNFDTNVVFPNRDGELKFEIIGNKGYCYMLCHNKNHNPKDYERKQ